MRGEPGTLSFNLKSSNVGFSSEVEWNEQGLLTRIALNCTPCVDSREPDWVPLRVLRFMDDLGEYFERGAPFSRIGWEDIAFSEWSEFQKRVYKATLLIPHGETRTYGWVALKIGAPLASRAVGQALRKNPIPLLVPCHRVISYQSLGGFMGEIHPEAPQLNLKRQLLELENQFVNPCFPFSTPYSLGA